MNEIARRPIPHMTADEFLVWPGDGSGRRFHLVDGEVWPMSPASVIHGAIQANLAQLILNALEAWSSTFQVVTEGAIIPGLSRGDNVRVPDIVVGSGTAVQGDLVVDNPVLIVEILSPGNKAVTRDNLRAYATLPSVREIVLLQSTRIEAELFARTEAGEWPAEPLVVRPGEGLGLATVGVACAVDRIYARTYLAAGAARPV